jgi:hypothetical protein
MASSICWTAGRTLDGAVRFRCGDDAVAESCLAARGGLLTMAPDRDLRDRHPHEQEQDGRLHIGP